ncbi:hypothetical protein CEXT_764931 [Caerostris extrusa]|uniref:Ankyrin repeat protein n=1 Tax=Caerostris extrusa TaxID=172846 RepID=A0AAV4YE10_CAEEX|nr:hypothetical protein CEXT_764931 [Caerostris extrusa]
MKLLLKIGADAETPQCLTTLLHIACIFDEVECAEILLNLRANVNTVVTNEMTPLYVACECASIPCIELLLKMDTDVYFATV